MSREIYTINLNLDPNKIFPIPRLPNITLESKNLKVGDKFIYRNYQIFLEWSEQMLAKLIDNTTSLETAIKKLQRTLRIEEQVIGEMEKEFFAEYNALEKIQTKYDQEIAKLYKKQETLNNLQSQPSLLTTSINKREKYRKIITNGNKNHNFLNLKIKTIPSPDLSLYLHFNLPDPVTLPPEVDIFYELQLYLDPAKF